VRRFRADLLNINVTLTTRLFLLLCVWLWVGTLAWADTLDLTDELAWPVTELQQVIEPDPDEARATMQYLEQVWPHAAFLALSISSILLPPVHASGYARVWSDRPVYERQATYRI
jgi:hypothetical protein